MLIDDLLKKINLSDGHRGYYMFETFILNLLKVHLEKSNKAFISQPRRIGFDGYAPEGLEDIKGGTQVEIKINLERLPFRRIFGMPRGRSQLRKLNATSGRSSVYRNNSIKYHIIIL